jgi:hypothetical protein
MKEKMHLKQLIRAHLSPQAIDFPIPIRNILFRKLDVKPNYIAFARNVHARAIMQMDGSSIPDIGEVSVRHHIDNSPDIV